jgi:ectoine hydroxylase-related dioxygenase (phytanoyl-CoA dioxygenase family)
MRRVPGDHEVYARDGYFRIDGFAGVEVGDGMLAEVVQLARAAATGEDIGPALPLPEAQPGFRGDHPEDRLSKMFRLHHRPAFRQFLETPAVLELVTSLLGPDVDCFLSQFIFKNPGAWGQPWHQDSYYFPFEPARPIVGLWLAVTDADLENGCLHVLPGSNREPVHVHVPDGRPGANYGYVEIVDHPVDAAVAVCMRPGDLLVFDSHLMHRSTDNVSNRIRAAMVYHCCVAGTVERETSATRSLVQDFTPLLRDGAVVQRAASGT